MPKIPAVCNSCGRAVESDYFLSDSTVWFEDEVVERCPCGGEIKVLAGTYSHLGGPLNLCNASPQDAKDFIKITKELGIPSHCVAP